MSWKVRSILNVCQGVCRYVCQGVCRCVNLAIYKIKGEHLSATRSVVYICRLLFVCQLFPFVNPSALWLSTSVILFSRGFIESFFCHILWLIVEICYEFVYNVVLRYRKKGGKGEGHEEENGGLCSKYHCIFLNLNTANKYNK